MMYVDESGDPGITNSPTKYFALSGMVIHESHWREMAEKMVLFRKKMKDIYNLPIRQEIHASEYINKRVLDIPKYNRLAIIRNFIDEIAQMPFISLTNVVVNKENKPSDFDVFQYAWSTLFQRFENTLISNNFPGHFSGNYGVVYTDNTDGEKLKKIMRKMNAYNPVPNRGGQGFRNMPVTRIIEDPSSKDSKESYFIQAVDVCAFSLYQKFCPCSFIRNKGATNYFDRLDAVLNKKASASNPQGIVFL